MVETKFEAVGLVLLLLGGPLLAGVLMSIADQNGYKDHVNNITPEYQEGNTNNIITPTNNNYRFNYFLQ